MPIVRVVEDHAGQRSAGAGMETWGVRSATNARHVLEAETNEIAEYQIKGDLSSDKANQQKKSTSLL